MAPERKPSASELGRLKSEIEAQLELETWWVEGLRQEDVTRCEFLAEGGRITSDKAVRSLLQHLAEGLALSIEETVQEHTAGATKGKGKAQKRSPRILADVLKSIEPFELAYLVLTAMTNTLMITGRGFIHYTSVPDMLADALEQELRMRAMVRLAPDLPGMVSSVVREGRSSLKHRLRVFTNLFHKRSTAEIPYLFQKGGQQRTDVGAALAELLLTPQGLTVVELDKQYDSKSKNLRYVFRPSEKLKAIIRREFDIDYLAKRTTPFGITLYEPNKRSEVDTEMLLTRDTPPMRINRLGGKSQDVLQRAIEQGYEGFSKVLTALTCLEQTPIRINEEMLQFVLENKEALKANGCLSSANLTLPDCPFPKSKKDLTPREQERLREWKKTTEKMHNEYWKSRSRILIQNRTLDLAQKLQSYPKFYFRHFADFRGRLYPVNTLLSFQGNPLCKSLLEFAEPSSLIVGDPHNAPWCDLVECGLRLIPEWSKRPVEDFTPWFDAREKLSTLVSDSLNLDSTLLWVGKKNFLPFIAWLLEIKRLLPSWGDWAKSGHPIRKDATCSSMQHMAALSGDLNVLTATNCVSDAVEIQDLYTAIVPNYKELGLERDWVKRFVMTFAYNSTDFTQTDEIAKSFEEKFGVRLPRDEALALKDTLKSAAYKGLGRIIQLQELLMDVFRQLIIKEELPAISRTPIGLLVDSSKFNWPVKRYRLYRLDAEIRLQMRDLDAPDAPRNLRKIKQSWVANIVHSMDATLLHVALNGVYNCYNSSSGKGKKRLHLATVHDCVVCRPGDMSIALQALNLAWVFMYAPSSDSGLSNALQTLLEYWSIDVEYPDLYDRCLELFQAAPESTFNNMKYFFV